MWNGFWWMATRWRIIYYDILLFVEFRTASIGIIQQIVQISISQFLSSLKLNWAQNEKKSLKRAYNELGLKWKGLKLNCFLIYSIAILSVSTFECRRSSLAYGTTCLNLSKPLFIVFILVRSRLFAAILFYWVQLDEQKIMLRSKCSHWMFALGSVSGEPVPVSSCVLILAFDSLFVRLSRHTRRTWRHRNQPQNSNRNC